MPTASKSIAIALLILAALILAPGYPLAAEAYVPATLYSQPPDPAGGLYQSSWWSPNEGNLDKYLWDNFTLPYTQEITGIQWRGGYDPNVFNGAGAVVDFEVAIYASNGAEPAHLVGPIVTYQTGGNAGETFAEQLGGVNTYNYSYTLPAAFAAQGGTTYWVYIVAAQAGNLVNPDWGLSKGTGGDTQHFRINHDGSVIEFRTGDLAFTLLGPPGMVCGIRTDPPNTPYALGGLTLTVTNLGTDLDCVSVAKLPINHPNATTGIQTGQYWHIEGLQSDRSTTAALDFTFDITLPHSIDPNTNAKVCKYPGNLGGAGWDCDRSGSDTTTVWRNGITSGFSDWAVGNNVGPTVLTVNSFSASSSGERTALAAILFGACAALTFTWTIWRGKRLE